MTFAIKILEKSSQKPIEKELRNLYPFRSSALDKPYS